MKYESRFTEQLIINNYNALNRQFKRTNRAAKNGAF